MFINNKVTRRISMIIIASYLSLITQSVQAAIQQEVFARPKPNTDHSTPVNQLEQMRELMRQLHNRQLVDVKPSRSSALMQWQTRQQQQEKTSTESLLALQDAVLQEGVAQEQQLQATEKHIKDKNLPASILQRHQTVLTQLQERRQQLQNTLQQLAKAQQQNKTAERKKILDALSVQLEKWGGEQAQMTDAKHLPWGSPSRKVRAPLDSKQAYYQHLDDVLGVKPLRVAGSLPSNMIWPVLPTLPDTPQATDTAENEDVQFTPAIQAKATELNHNPAQIYKWVYDNIEYVPTYGSIQGADFTLQSKRGNAFDTSSLLIALLRASNVPARYVYGTIEVPAKQLLNWVGGVNTVDAAQNLMGQGGIPNVALTQGGQNIAIRMEHVWVEAYVDFVPSRGVVNRIPDTWIPLDASYKQYAYTPAMDLAQAVPFDAQAVISAAQQGAVVNEQNGSIQNINQTAIQNALTDYQIRLKEFLEQKNKATVGDVLGEKIIKHYMARGLSNSLQYKITAVAGDYHTLPEAMRHYVVLKLFTSNLDISTESSILEYKTSLPYISGKKLDVTYIPASADDLSVISTYKSESATSLPAYLIRMKPLIQLEGHTIMEGKDLEMASQAIWAVTFESPNSSDAKTSYSYAKVGDESVLGINSAGISSDFVSQRYISHFVETATASENLNMVALHFWMLHDILDSITAKTKNVVVVRLPSFGWFSSPVTAKYAFGIPIKAYYDHRNMDVQNNKVAAVTNQGDMPIDFMLQIGVQGSFLEGFVFDWLFTKSIGNGLSSSQVILSANSNGLRNIILNKENYSRLLPSLKLPDKIIRQYTDAINAGNIIISPESEVTKGNWKGVGFIIFDKQTGRGAYLLDGNTNGGSSCGEGQQVAPFESGINAMVVTSALLIAAAIIIAVEAPLIFAVSRTVAAISQSQTVIQIGVGVSALFLIYSDAIASDVVGPPTPDGMFINPDCPPAIHAALSAAYELKCNQSGSFACQNGPPSGNVNCTELLEKKAKALDCIYARINLMNACFHGGDQTHHDQIRQRQQGVNKCDRLIARYCSGSGCTP